MKRSPQPGFWLVPLLLIPVACGGSSDSKETSSNDANMNTEANAPDPGPRKSGPIDGVYAVQCGCQIDGINACGNYVHVGGHAFEIEGDLGLGAMEWCSVDGTKQAKIQGNLDGDKCYATSLTVQP